MSVLSISSNDEVYGSLKIDDDHWEVEQLAQKTHSVWSQIYDVTVGSFIKVIQVLRSVIGAIARDAFFLPLKWPFLANRQFVQDQLQIEEDFSRDFWDPSKPLDPSFKDQAMIREKFAPPEDRVFPIQLPDGKSVEITCRIIETKEKAGDFYNFIQMPGIYSTIDNNVVAVYPYLAAYLNVEKSLPPARFIIISENNLNYKPATLDEAGLILLETLKAMRAEFGEIDQLVAHSLGNIFFSSALKQVDDPAVLPKHICMDRGPSSIFEASKKYFWGLGGLFYFLLEFGKWAADLEQDVVDFCLKWKNRPPIVVTGVVQDHHFSGGANLCMGEKIRHVDGVDVLVFDPPRQVAHQHAHHNLRTDFLNSRYLIEESDFMGSSENFPEAIIRHSFPVEEKRESESA